MTKQEIIEDFEDLCGTLSITNDSVGSELIKKYFDAYSSILLSKYIKYVKEIEGSDFILIHNERVMSSVDFENEEWELLKSIANKL